MGVSIMQQKKWLTKVLALGLSVVLFSANTVQAKAFIGGVDNSGYQNVFDAQYYYNNYPDLRDAIGMDEKNLLEHFINLGIAEGRSGMEEFNLRAYIQNNPDLMEAFGEDYSAYCRHYIETGKAEGRNALADNINSDKNVIGTYASTYDTSEQRAINVELAAARINGMVLQPGAEFSFNKAVLPRTYVNGYVLGPSFVAGREVVSVGGGICQVSSTLYVAMIQAVLPSTERHLHSAPVDYVPTGLDATIAGNSKDLKFVNIYSKPLTISAVAVDGELTIELIL